MSETRWIYLIPTGTADIPGVPAVPYRCKPEEAAALLRPQPPAFAESPVPVEGAVRPAREHIRALMEAH